MSLSAAFNRLNNAVLRAGVPERQLMYNWGIPVKAYRKQSTFVLQHWPEEREVQRSMFRLLKETDLPTSAKLLRAWEQYKADVKKERNGKGTGKSTKNTAKNTAKPPTLANLPLDVFKAHVEPLLGRGNLASLATASKGTKSIVNARAGDWPALKRALKAILLAYYTDFTHLSRKGQVQVGIPGLKNHMVSIRTSDSKLYFEHPGAPDEFYMYASIASTLGKSSRLWTMPLVSLVVEDRDDGWQNERLLKRVWIRPVDDKVTYYVPVTPGSPHARRITAVSGAERDALQQRFVASLHAALIETWKEMEMARAKGALDAIRREVVTSERALEEQRRRVRDFKRASAMREAQLRRASRMRLRVEQERPDRAGVRNVTPNNNVGRRQ